MVDLPDETDDTDYVVSFMMSVVDQFSISPAQTQVALVVYNEETSTEIKLDDFSSAGSLKDALEARLISASARTGDASSHDTGEGLRRCRKVIYFQPNGDRDDDVSENVVILITGNEPDSASNARSQANKLRENAKIVAVGIGSAFSNPSLLNDIGEGEYVVFDTYEDLDDGWAQVVRKSTDEIATDTPDDDGEQCDSDSMLDVVFVVDSSGSICPSRDECDNYLLMKAFMKNLVSELEIEETGTRIGLVLFSYTAKNMFFLKDFDEEEDVFDAIDDLPYEDGKTNISGGLWLMSEVQFTTENGDRKDARNVAIVITDGNANEEAEHTVTRAKHAKSQGITIFSVGINATRDLNEDELKAISSEPQRKNSNYFISPNFEALSSIAAAVLSAVICEGNYN